ncbi:MAG: hybrid sensor histidine kinase/response regulator [Rhodobacterales bacterium CG_4_9_14_3_um_filter_71_31]|nr:MAG: hybrid sensor histidine kinase/response regulator [Rhodobacterales bacterium CG_4_9_14_3_um_filter_71_31]
MTGGGEMAARDATDGAMSDYTMGEAAAFGGGDPRVDDALSDNERLRQVNDALRARMERQGGADSARRPGEAAESPGWIRRYVEVALDAADAALALFTEEGRLLAVNRRLSALVPDVAPRLTPGLRFDEAARLLSGSVALALPDEAARAAWAQARIDGRGLAAAPAATPLGDGRWVEVSERATGQGAFALAFDDVTEAMLSRRSARVAAPVGREALLSAALDHLPLGFGAFDPHGQLTFWNEPFRTLMGLGVGDLREGLAFSQLAHRITRGGAVDPDGPARRVALWVAAHSPRAPLTVEIARRDGVLLMAQCRETGAGGFALSLTDVTAERLAAAEVARVRRTLESRVNERTAALVEVNDRLVQEVAERRAIEAEMRRARDAAEAADLSKTRFLAAASHDLLQPLNAAKLFISALSAGSLPPEAAAIALKVESAFASVETLLNALLDISRLDAGGGEAQVADFPIMRILEPVAEEFRPVAAERGLRLRVAPCSAVVRSDPHYLRRIVQNLVSNALKYTMKGGVVVGCRRRGAMLRLEVWDSGVGIPAAERRRVFEEFHRLDAANPRGERGMGLGLAIVDRASRLLGHAVDIRSAEGAGSVFAVTLPLGDARAAAARALAPEPQAVFDGATGMIALVIEDDPSVRAATAALLGRWGVDVLEAHSGEAALALARQIGLAPDVLLVDYHLMGETGVGVLARVRAAFDAPIPAIVITADRSRAVADAVARAGAQLLTKPVAPAKLRALLHWSAKQIAR